MAGNKNSGRRPFEPTDEQREKVRVLTAAGMTQDEIAAAIDISAPTLRKHFAFDLKIGAAKVAAEVHMARYKAAIGGNVSAQNKLAERIASKFPPGPAPDEAEAKPAPLGKKEQQQKAAEAVGGRFRPRPPPNRLN